jgi:hypothetical protein
MVKANTIKRALERHSLDIAEPPREDKDLLSSERPKTEFG